MTIRGARKHQCLRAFCAGSAQFLPIRSRDKETPVKAGIEILTDNQPEIHFSDKKSIANT